VQANETTDGSADDVERRVRTRLRQLRTDRGLTLRQVAERAAIDLSTLSRLESGKRRLALDHLPRLAGALGVTVDDLVGPAKAPDPRVRGEPETVNGATMWPLTRHGPARGLHAYKIVIEASRNEPPEQLPVHDGHGWLYVLGGRMRLILGDDDLVIEPGEAVEFATTTPHWFGAVDGAVEVLALIGPSGEQLHLH
jgi:transcriptional regulator with XRE-family HTH domain